MEIVDDTHMAEISHPAFNKLFLESEYVKEQNIFLAKRRQKNEADNPYVMHMVKTDEKRCKKVEFENDRKTIYRQKQYAGKSRLCGKQHCLF